MEVSNPVPKAFVAVGIQPSSSSTIELGLFPKSTANMESTQPSNGSIATYQKQQHHTNSEHFGGVQSQHLPIFIPHPNQNVEADIIPPRVAGRKLLLIQLSSNRGEKFVAIT